MNGQISIFDWMPPEQPSFDDVQEPEAVRLIGDALGLTFRYDKRFQEWAAKAGKLKMHIDGFSHYDGVRENRRFLGVGWERGTSGGGCPCESIQEAISYFRKVKQHD